MEFTAIMQWDLPNVVALWCVSDSLGSIFKQRLLGFSFRILDSLGLDWSPRNCSSNKFRGDAK